mgnify:CR=1 FL=1
MRRARTFEDTLPITSPKTSRIVGCIRVTGAIAKLVGPSKLVRGAVRYGPLAVDVGFTRWQHAFGHMCWKKGYAQMKPSCNGASCEQNVSSWPSHSLNGGGGGCAQPLQIEGVGAGGGAMAHEGGSPDPGSPDPG